ncbi:hypothetical protein [Imhoffiella purpurea]|uniref:hypothetical protein n=1 Tax=Imhoffiella purpurea TaxID=1249627 RepID=UPI0005C1CCEB|nr:hypothetical protein [Imhoffiella purpurea]
MTTIHLTFHQAPTEPGWYFVQLQHGHPDGKPYDVDYFYGIRHGIAEWATWYAHNISACAPIESCDKTEDDPR